jgi:hypothetical protein
MAKKCRCPRRTCHKRRGSPRFAAACKSQFRACMREVLKDTGSMRAAGKKCMPELHRCNKRPSHSRAISKYKRARSA